MSISAERGTARRPREAQRAAPIPQLIEGEPPIAVLVDYDGTIALTDVSDTIMAEFVTGEWEEMAARYDAGLIGSRRLMELEMEMLGAADPAALMATAAAQPHDAGFAPFVARARQAGVPVEVVSDGYGFFIQSALAALGVSDLPVVTARTGEDRLSQRPPDLLRVRHLQAKPRAGPPGGRARGRVRGRR